MPYTKEQHRKVASQMQRDEHGHFVNLGQGAAPQSKNPIGNYVSAHSHYSKNKDDLLDVHVGNPLTKITRLLEDIKRQKAFSFTLKGSLGIAGVALALGIFGVFGGGHLLCSRGVQTHIGTVKILQYAEVEKSSLPVIGHIMDYFVSKQTHNRIVLIKENSFVVSLIGSNKILQEFNNTSIIATGDYNSCSQTLSVSNPSGIETFLDPVVSQ